MAGQPPIPASPQLHPRRPWGGGAELVGCRHLSAGTLSLAGRPLADPWAGVRGLAGVPAPPVMPPPGKGPQGLSRVGVTPSSSLSCTGTSRKHTAWARRARLRDRGSVSAPHRTGCSQRKLAASPPRLRRAVARAGPLPTGLPPEPLLTPLPSPPRPSHGVCACSRLRQARVHGLGQGLESGPGRPLSEEPWVGGPYF